MNLVIGSLGDIGCIPFIVPLELMSMQLSEGNATWGSVIKKTWKEQGISGFYAGWAGYALGSCLPAFQCVPPHLLKRPIPSSSFEEVHSLVFLFVAAVEAHSRVLGRFTAFDQGKRLWLAYLGAGGTELSAVASFVLGAISRAIADLITFPTTVIQNIQQSQRHPLKDEGFFTIMASLYKSEVRPFPQAWRAPPSADR
jgi:hypothetical protein